MIIFILTSAGYKDAELSIKLPSSITWINDGILSTAELENLRSSGVEITNFTYRIDSRNGKVIDEALNTIMEHHPGEKIWIEQ